jgi:hypothetical protein
MASEANRQTVPGRGGYSIDPLYPHWFRCEQCGKDVSPLFPPEAIDLVNLTAAQVLEVCPEAEADI